MIEEKLLKETAILLKTALSPTKTYFKLGSISHILKRMKERNIHIIDVRSTLHSLMHLHLCELVYITYLPKNVQPMTLEVRSKNCILILGREDTTLWSFRTVLDPKYHNKHNDELPTNWQYTINI